MQETAWLIAAVVAVLALDGLCWFGFTVVPPNTARVVLLFGDYPGSIKTPGFWWVNPLTTRRRVSLEVRNFESGKLKVNDHIGNPIEIAAIVVWRVVDTAEAAVPGGRLRALRPRADRVGRAESRDDASRTTRTKRASCRCADRPPRSRSGCGEEIQDRLAKAGVEVIEARISHLAYAPEIANAMLRRQQATAIIAARQKIVEGAVGMVEMALDAAEQQAGRRARRGAQGGDGEQPARRALQRSRRAAGRERGHAVPIGHRGRA